jgi:hypothetical protein
MVVIDMDNFPQTFAVKKLSESYYSGPLTKEDLVEELKVRSDRLRIFPVGGYVHWMGLGLLRKSKRNGEGKKKKNNNNNNNNNNEETETCE